MGLARKVRLEAVPALLGILTGVGVLIWLTFGSVDVGTVDTGLIALVPNLVVTTVAQLVVRSRSLAAVPAEAN